MKNVFETLIGLAILVLIGFGISYFLEIQIGNVNDWLVGIFSFIWLMIITTVPWNAHFKAKEVFNRVREVQDNIADALLNLGHIYLAQKKHPEALQMYQNYMKRTEDGTVPITSKSRVDDLADVELYIAFAYFDWARHTELFNNAKEVIARYYDSALINSDAARSSFVPHPVD